MEFVFGFLTGAFVGTFILTIAAIDWIHTGGKKK